MYYTFWKLIILCGIVGMIKAGVKIEISRVKDPPKTSTPSPNMEANEIETTEATTIPTTTIPVTEPTIKPIIESNIQKLTNLTSNSTNSTIDVTTAAPLNATETLKPAQANITNTNTALVYNNNVTLVSAKNINPYLSEFTRREMRRRLIPPDYYCPCDLKVR